MVKSTRKDKTFHAWTQDEDKSLMKAVRELKPQIKRSSNPDGIPISVLWGQIPGRIGVMATPLACSLRYKKLSGSSRLKNEQRKVAKIAQPVIAALEAADSLTSEESDGGTGDLVGQAEHAEQDRYVALADRIDDLTGVITEMRDLMRGLLDVWAPKPTPPRAERPEHRISQQ